MVRIFEYATQVDITTAESDVSETVFTMPTSGVLHLRCNDKTPDFHTIVLPGSCVRQSSQKKVKEGVGVVMGGQVLDYEAKRIRNDRDTLAVFNMLTANVDEQTIRKMYPDQFEAGKQRFLNEKNKAEE